MSKKKRGSQRNSSASMPGGKGNLAVRALLTIGLIALVFVGIATLWRPQQDVQTSAPNPVSSGTDTQAQPDSSEADNTTSNARENSVADDAAVVEEVVADLPTAPEVGALAPDFALATINGEQLALTDLHGKPMFISFFHSW